MAFESAVPGLIALGANEFAFRVLVVCECLLLVDVINHDLPSRPLWFCVAALRPERLVVVGAPRFTPGLLHV